jgi:hypothetical protein
MTERYQIIIKAGEHTFHEECDILFIFHEECDILVEENK